MPLTGKQFQQIHSTLLNAFDRASLQQLAQFELDTNLDHVAGGQNQSDLVHNLMVWAIEQGRLVELVDGAARQNSGSPLVQ